MALQLIYQMFAKLLSWIVLHTRSDTSKEIEVLVLRHQLAVLQRRTPHPQMSWSDRALIAALTRLLLLGARTRATGPDQRFQAAVSYSLMSPPRIGRRRILPRTGSGTGDVGRGGRSCSARCGRAVL